MKNQIEFDITKDGKMNYKGLDGSMKQLNPEIMKALKQQAKQRVLVTKEIGRCKKALESVTDEDEKILLKTQLANAEKFKEDMEHKQKEQLSRLEGAQTPLADATKSNAYVYPIFAFFEAFYASSKKTRLILKEEDMLIAPDTLPLDVEKAVKEDAKIGEGKTDNLSKVMAQTGGNCTYQECGEDDESRMAVIVLTKGSQKDFLPLQERQTYESLKDNKAFSDRLLDQDTITIYSIDKKDYLTSAGQILLSDDKEKALKECPTVKREQDFTMSAFSPSEGKSQLDKLNDEQREHLMKYYDASKGMINPQRTDFSPLMQKGIDVRRLSEKDCKALLLGSMTSLIPTIEQRDGQILKGECKVRLGKNDRAEGRAVIIERLQKPLVPTEIFGKRLNDQQRKELQTYGRMSKAIDVVAAGKNMKLLPYIDKDTNQLMMRDMSSVKLPDEFQKKNINIEQKTQLLEGKTVLMSGLQDNMGQTYSGYVRVNPMSGVIESLSQSTIDYSHQVSANNHGERVGDLKYDKDSVLKSGQIRNDDAKTITTKKIKGIKI